MYMAAMATADQIEWAPHSLWVKPRCLVHMDVCDGLSDEDSHFFAGNFDKLTWVVKRPSFS
jgi:hypothetical protein